jgi:DNA replication protein DnaC
MRIPGIKIVLTEEHLAWMRVPMRFWEVKSGQIQESFRDLIRDYRSTLGQKMDDGVGLILWGPNGVGKTGAAVVVAKAAREAGASVLFITAESFRQATLDKEKFDDGLLVTDRAMGVDVLVLDDLGKEHSGESSWAERLIENLIRVRAANKRVTIITTNMNPGQMEERYKRSMMEVLMEACVRIQADGESLREKPSLK